METFHWDADPHGDLRGLYRWRTISAGDYMEV
jgi:hypothetical protein